MGGTLWDRKLSIQAYFTFNRKIRKKKNSLPGSLFLCRAPWNCEERARNALSKRLLNKGLIIIIAIIIIIIFINIIIITFILKSQHILTVNPASFPTEKIHAFRAFVANCLSASLIHRVTPLVEPFGKKMKQKYFLFHRLNVFAAALLPNPAYMLAAKYGLNSSRQVNSQFDQRLWSLIHLVGLIGRASICEGCLLNSHWWGTF